MLLDDLAGVALERRPAAHALPGDHPEGVDVGPPVDHPAPQHLGRAVVDGGGQGLPVAALGGRPDQAEVGHLDRLAGQQEVLRLDVEVDDAGMVGVVEGVGHRPQQLGGGLGAEAVLAVEHLAQGPAADVLHHDPGQAPLLARVVDGDDVGMGQAGGRAGLAPELVGEPAVAGELGAGDLDRHHPVELPVVAPVDDGHAALGDAGDDLVAAAAERPADKGVQVGGVSGEGQSQGRSPPGGHRPAREF